MMVPSIRLAWPIFAVLALTTQAGCSGGAPAAPPAHLVERSHVSMGTEIALTAWTADDARAEAAFTAVFGEFDRLDSMMSVWKEGSDILRLNAAAGDHAVPVNADTREVLKVARQVSDLTDGKFDVTFGALSEIRQPGQGQQRS
jgi:thiamine biosynthesis lipoprotein